MALAALTTGGTFSVRGGGRAFVETRPPLLCEAGAIVVIEVLLVSAELPGLLGGTAVTDWLDSPEVKSCRRTGSDDAWNLDATAGVFKNAPGTGRNGVVCGNDMLGSRTTLVGS